MVGPIRALKSKLGDRISALRHINSGCTPDDGESGVGSRESGVGGCGMMGSRESGVGSRGMWNY
ncbi:hypothetical protein QUB09_31530 [Microcoleus sp. C2C6]